MMKNINYKDKILDLALIIGGILIALWINNWNESRKDIQTEQVILQNLKEEFLLNREELNHTEIDFTRTMQATREVLMYFSTDENEIRPRLLDSLLYHGFVAPRFVPSETALNDIIYSGKMDLLRNPRLKNLLLTWDSKMKDFKVEEFNMYRNLNQSMLPKLEKIMSFRNIDKYGPIQYVGDSKLIENNLKLLQNLEAENMFDNHLWELTNTHGFYPELLELIDEILREIE